MATLRRLARGAVSDLRARPVAIVHGAGVLLAAWLVPLAAGLGYVWATDLRGELLVGGYVLVEVLAVVPVALADLVVVRGFAAPDSTARSACRAVGRRWHGTLPWALLAAVGLVPILASPVGGTAFAVIGGLISPVLFLAPAAVALVLTVPYALTLAVPVVVAGGNAELAGGFRDGVRTQWQLLRRAPATTVGAAVLAAAPLAVTGVLVAVGMTLTLVGLAMAWLVVPLVLVVLGLPLLLLGLAVMPVAYAFARALVVRATVATLTETGDASQPDEGEVDGEDEFGGEIDGEDEFGGEIDGEDERDP